MVLQNHRPLRREIFTDEVVLPALSHHTPHLPQRTTPPRAQWHEGEWCVSSSAILFYFA